MKVNKKDYAFLKAVLELDEKQGKMNTSEIRALTDEEDNRMKTLSGVVELNNNDVNNKLAKFGGGNTQMSGRGMFETLGKDEDYAGRGSKPKLLRLKDERRAEVEQLVEKFNPSTDFEGFDSVQEALDFYISTTEDTRQTVENNKEMIQEIAKEFQKKDEQIEELTEEVKALREDVDDNTTALNKLRENVKPLVLGMVEELEEKIGFDPKDYL